MPLTKDFRATVKARADRDPAFRAGLYQEAVQAMLDGDFATGRRLLRDFINATIGFPALARRLGVNDKSLMRMLGAAGNPNVGNLLAVLQALKAECRLSLHVEAKPVKTPPGRPRADGGLLAASRAVSGLPAGSAAWRSASQRRRGGKTGNVVDLPTAPIHT
jgi:DNA-binding phage protein